MMTLRDYNFKPGALVLVRNTQIETDLDRKTKPCYLYYPRPHMSVPITSLVDLESIPAEERDMSD
jgi:hypothetical protein